MQIQREQISPTSVKLSVVADQDAIDTVKEKVVSSLSQNAKVPGFRAGKAPSKMVEKQLDQELLQSEFLQEAISQLYEQAARHEKLRVVAQPQVSVTKFVHFTTLEFSAEVEVVGAIKMPDYKKVKLARKKVTLTPKDINEVVENLLERAAEKSEVKRAAKNGDQVTIDFAGVDTKTKEAIPGTDGKDYPLTLGSKAFIPGFEEEVVGLKPKEKKTFTITFPADYNVESLKKRKVDFTVTATKIEELKKVKADDAFAKTAGPFKTMAELKADIKKQLTVERQREADQAYDNELLAKIAEKTEVAIPGALINEDIDRLEEEEKRNVTYKGQTWQEHLDAEGVTAEEHRERQRGAAEQRVKAGLIVGEIAQTEGIEVTPEELADQLEKLKKQYPDETMQAELDKPENQRDIVSRLAIEKTINKLRSYASK